MIDLYTWSTPNGRKISIALEEMGIAYRVFPVDIGKNEQFAPDFLKLSPNNKIPAILDRDAGISLFESGAILLYLAEKTGQFLPKEGVARWKVIQWLMWQVSSFGPPVGQANHFLFFNPGQSSYAEERFKKEAMRLYGVLEAHLSQSAYLGDEYSIADMALWPWVAGIIRLPIDVGVYPNIARWYKEIAQRPKVIAGYQALSVQDIPMPFGE